jgi:hypothetical protein
MTFLYPTASTTAVFINGYHVEQAYQLQYKEDINKIPIYGYNDYYYSKIAVGRCLVQGILVVNFISPGYLNAVLEEPYAKATSTPKKLYNFGFTADKKTQDEKYKEDLKNELRTELPPMGGSYGVSDQENELEYRRARAEYISKLVSGGDQKAADKAKEALFDLFIPTFTKPSPSNGNRNINSYKQADSPLAIDNQNGLTLDIYYQDPSKSLWWVSFKNVHIYEVSQTISQAGAEGSSDPLYEVYPWIASKKVIHMVN